MRTDFCFFILAHGRPDNCPTAALLDRLGTRFPRYIVLDDGDETRGEYERIFGVDRVLVFNRAETHTDTADNFDDCFTPVEARNACFDFARNLGFSRFCELDDDYIDLNYRYQKGDSLSGAKFCGDFDRVCEAMIQFLDSSPRILSVCFGQGGDFIGGANAGIWKSFLRKAMNSFFCSVEKPFRFRSHFNDDVSTYVCESQLGYIFSTAPRLSIHQFDTQQIAGGITESYRKYGTYVKTMQLVMQAPSCVKIGSLAIGSFRYHHKIDQLRCYPKILSEKWRRT